MDFPWTHNKIIDHCRLLATSFNHWTKKDLFPGDFDWVENSFHLYHASFALVSHGVEDDPIFNYANQKALELWKMDWDSFTKMPSRLSAEEVEIAERNRLLDETTKNGFISNYNGIRISSKGERFRIKDTILWNVIDEKGNYRGQAAMITSWENI